MNIVDIFLKALCWTVLIETLCLWIFTKILLPHKRKISLTDIVFTGIFASWSTIPYLWFVWPKIVGADYVLSGEILVTLIETIIIKKILKITIGQALVLSILCNLVSYSLGKYIM